MTPETTSRRRCADDPAPAFGRASDRPGPRASEDADDSEVMDDGQEEVFSRTAIENGMVQDPQALGPEDLARVPLSRTQNAKA